MKIIYVYVEKQELFKLRTGFDYGTTENHVVITVIDTEGLLYCGAHGKNWIDELDLLAHKHNLKGIKFFDKELEFEYKLWLNINNESI